MIKWGFYQFKGNPEKCYQELQTLGESYTPEDVVSLAEDPHTELHKCFTWDDSKAARLYRLTEARTICNSLRVVVERESGEPREYRIVQHDSVEKAYKPVVLMVRNEDEYSRLLEQAKDDMRRFKERYTSIVELAEVIEEIEKVL